MTVTKESLIEKLRYGLDPTSLDEFLASEREQEQQWKPIVAEVKALWEAGEIELITCYNCGCSGNGSSAYFMSGSLGTLCADCYDEVEGDL